jgi:hypothetical protein
MTATLHPARRQSPATVDPAGTAADDDEINRGAHIDARTSVRRLPLLSLRLIAVERFYVDSPRERHGLWVEADLVITGLIGQRAGDRETRLPLERGGTGSRGVEHDVLDEAKRALENRHPLIQRLEKILLRFG